MPFLIVKALVPVKYPCVCMGLESVGGAVFCFLPGLVTYYLSLDMQSSYAVSKLISYLATNVNIKPCELT